MPYIDQESRDALVWNSITPDSPGELNYKITMLVIDYIEQHGLNYQHINDILGALEGAKLEFYRRVAVPYEDSKIEQNGDVYE